MTKKKLHEEVLALCAKHKASGKLTEELSALTIPKVGGSSDVTDYTVFDEESQPTHIFCNYHKKWEPVTAVDEDENEVVLFDADEKGKNGYKRYCIMADSQYKEASKVFNASKKAIMDDVLDGKMEGPAAKVQIDELTTARATHPEREDGLGETDKPGSDAKVEETEEV